MSNKTLCTALDVVYENGLDQNIDTNRITPFIYDIEQERARMCFGFEFYDKMLADKIDRGTLEEWTSQAEYVIGNAVIFRGRIYIALITSTGKPINDTTAWAIATTFNVTAYEDLWIKFMRAYLSTEIWVFAFPHVVVQVKATGLVKRKDNKSGAEPAGRGDYVQRSTDLRIVADMRLLNLLAWLDLHVDDAIYLDEKGVSFFADFKKLGCGAEIFPPNSGHTFFFRNNE